MGVAVRGRVIVATLCLAFVEGLSKGGGGGAIAQERLCPDGKRAYFGVCPNDGNNSRPLSTDTTVVPEPKSDPKPDPVVVVPPAPDRKDLQERISRIAGGLRCAGVQVSLTQGRLKVSGFVENELDVAKLRDAAAPAGSDALLDLKVRPWSQCEALLTLDKPIKESAGLTIVARQSDLKEGDRLEFQVTTPDYPSYLYISYLQADGQVAHVHRYADQGGRALPAGTRLTLGSKGEYPIVAPFGPESIVAVASALPLLALDRPRRETEREFLTEFRMAILEHQADRRKISAALLPVTTSRR